MAKKTNNYWRRIKFALYITIAALVPFGIRLGYYLLNQKEIPFFYKNEWDLFVFCIAIAVAIIAENKPSKADNYGHIIHVLLLILISSFFLFMSLNCEHQNIVLNNDLQSHLQSKNFDLNYFKDKISNNESKKNTLFHVSIILAILFFLDCFYITVLKKNK